jgi:predicted DNA-binding transcriptional regulator YafY
MLRCLPRTGSGISTPDLHKMLLAKGYQVEKRTVERDLRSLKDTFDAYIKCNDKSKPFGWRWQDDTDFQVVGISMAEALSLQTIGDAIKPLFPASVFASLEPRIRQARAILDELAPKNRHAAWAKKIRSVQPSLPMLAPQIDAEALLVVQEALLNDECIKAQYQSAGRNEPREILLHPLALVQRGPVTYLVARASEHAEARLYAMHRFSSAERTYEAATPPDDFDIDQYIAEGNLQFGNSQATGTEIRFEAKVADWLMQILKETPLSVDQKFIPSGDEWRVKATVRDTFQLQWWILAQGPALEVVAPKALRQRVGEEVHAMAARYLNLVTVVK